MRDMLSALNIFVSDSPLAARYGLPTIVLLCPGFFEQPSLVKLLSSTVLEARPESPATRKSGMLQHLTGMHRSSFQSRRGSRAGRACRASFGEAHESRPLTKRARTLARSADRARSLAHGLKRRLSMNETAHSQHLCFFSTERSFAHYIAQCRHHAPHLLDAGVFNSFFQKWPPSPMLQLAVGAYHLHPLLPPPPPIKTIEELRWSTCSQRGAPRDSGRSPSSACLDVIKKTLPEASTHRELTLTQRNTNEGTPVVLEARRSIHDGTRRRSHLDSPGATFSRGASGRLITSADHLREAPPSSRRYAARATSHLVQPSPSARRYKARAVSDQLSEHVQRNGAHATPEGCPKREPIRVRVQECDSRDQICEVCSSPEPDLDCHLVHFDANELSTHGVTGGPHEQQTSNRYLVPLAVRLPAPEHSGAPGVHGHSQSSTPPYAVKHSSQGSSKDRAPDRNSSGLSALDPFGEVVLATPTSAAAGADSEVAPLSQPCASLLDA